MPWALFCVVAWSVLEWAGDSGRLPRPLFGLWSFPGGLGFFFAPHCPNSVALDHWMAGTPWSAFPERLGWWAAMLVFVDFLIFPACLVTLHALALVRRSLDDRRRKQAVEAENLALRLEVERHRLAALQAQLEPHFSADETVPSEGQTAGSCWRLDAGCQSSCRSGRLCGNLQSSSVKCD